MPVARYDESLPFERISLTPESLTDLTTALVKPTGSLTVIEPKPQYTKGFLFFLAVLMKSSRSAGGFQSFSAFSNTQGPVIWTQAGQSSGRAL